MKVETGLEPGCMMGVAEGLDEEDEEEVQKVEHWTNSLINQGSFDASAQVKDIHNWQRECPTPMTAHPLLPFLFTSHPPCIPACDIAGPQGSR